MKHIRLIFMCIGVIFLLYDALWILVLLENSVPTAWMIYIFKKIEYTFNNPWIGFLIGPLFFFIGLLFYDKK